MKKKPLGCFLGALLSMLFVFASGILQIYGGNPGEIIVDLSTSEELPGFNSSFSLIRVAEKREGRWQTLDPFQDEEQILNGWEENDASKCLSISCRIEHRWIELSRDPINLSRALNGLSEGKEIIFSGLEPGLYLLTNKRINGFSPYQPVLIELSAVPAKTPVRVVPKAESPMVVIEKIDPVRKAITGSGFEFQVFADSKCTQKLEVLGGDPRTGKTDGFSLKAGQTVYLKETQAPEGYQISRNVVSIFYDGATVQMDGQTASASDQESKTVFIKQFINERKKHNSSSPSGDDPSSSASSKDPKPGTSHRSPSSGSSNSASGENRPVKAGVPHTAADSSQGMYFWFLTVSCIAIISLFLIRHQQNRE